MLITRRTAWAVLGCLVAALFLGTLMPNAWRSGIEQEVHAPFPLSSWAHFAVFAGLAVVAFAKPLARPAWQVLLMALALALLSEGLQFFAVDRHPRLIDVGIDMAGAACGLTSCKTAQLLVSIWRRK